MQLLLHIIYTPLPLPQFYDYAVMTVSTYPACVQEGRQGSSQQTSTLSIHLHHMLHEYFMLD